ncbi:MAG: GHKL domain-containing protein, partial [Gammaproteobacteria bacterium]|nr:GHKL domain-containing protein [Gammaproteobacteria bacterium]
RGRVGGRGALTRGRARVRDGGAATRMRPHPSEPVLDVMIFVRSLRGRVLLWVSIALIALFAITVAVLDVAFRQSTERARQELLEVQMLGLIGLAEESGGELTLPQELIDPQFEVADSGLYAVLWDAEGRPLWQSLSMLSREFPVKTLPDTGEQRYMFLQPEGFPPLEALLMGIAWPFDDGRVEPYTLGIAVSLEPYNERQGAFRRNLIVWFTGITAVMLLVLTGLLRWVLTPLRTLETQVREVEAGERVRLAGEYPTELMPLASNLNALIETERRRLVRYRNTLDDLAHSLKTPLAAMRSLLPESGASVDKAEAIERELERMDQRVSHQLRRARASGATGLGVEPVAVAPVLEDLKQTLDKVYRDKGVVCDVRVEGRVVFQGDPGDLMELLGNLLDNAYKYCRSRVAVHAAMQRGRVIVTIGDDGPGIGADELDRLLERGVRADESVPGQGIGLAVVRETVELYGGTLDVRRSPLGGAEIRIALGRAGAEV